MWFFRSPLIVFGEDALSHLTHEVCSRAFIVTDEVMGALGNLERVIDQLEGCRAEVGYFIVSMRRACLSAHTKVMRLTFEGRPGVEMESQKRECDGR